MKNSLVCVGLSFHFTHYRISRLMFLVFLFVATFLLSQPSVTNKTYARIALSAPLFRSLLLFPCSPSFSFQESYGSAETPYRWLHPCFGVPYCESLVLFPFYHPYTSCSIFLSPFLFSFFFLSFSSPLKKACQTTTRTKHNPYTG